jgi:hypothetical protein
MHDITPRRMGMSIINVCERKNVFEWLFSERKTL